MWCLFFLHSFRYLARHRTLTLLNILGIALGATVFLSIQIVNHSALESFRASVDIVAGKANLEIIGDGLNFPEETYRTVVHDPDISAATPTVEEVASLADFPGQYLHILGIDIFSNGPFRTFDLRDDKQKKVDALNFFQDPHTIAITQKLSQRLGLKIGDTLRLVTQTGTENFHIGFLLDFGADAPGADEHLAVMDIANAQENFRHVGQLSRISALLRPKADPAKVIADLQQRVPANVMVQSPDRRGQQIERMISAFQLNLTALSLISLLVGMFLIYNTVVTAVVRRRFEIGVLRALGLSPFQVQFLFLAEAFLLGIAGLLVGLVLGVILAGQLVGAVSQTITSLYILTSIQTLFISPWSVLVTVILALSAVLGAAWFPARDAALLPPVEALNLGHLQEKSVRGTTRWLVLGLGLLALAGILAEVSLHFGPAWLSFGSALFTLLGFAFFVPSTSQLFTRVVKPRSILAKIALGQFARSLHRNSFTLAALVTALAMVVGISTMIYSFRMTVEAWLNRSVQADVLIAPAENLLIGNREVVRPEVENIVQHLPGLKACDSFREVHIQFQGKTVKLVSTQLAVTRAYNRLVFAQGSPDTAFDQAIHHETVLISQPFARRFHLNAGDHLTLGTALGIRDFPISGVYLDYTTEAGVILLDRALYQKYWQDTSINGLAVYAGAGQTSEDIQNTLRPQLAPYGDYLIKSNHELREQIFRIFDQTFSVTYVLQTIGILISALGIFLSLTILVAERQRELSILRAVGASQNQITILVLMEAGIIGLIGSGLGLIAGLALAAILSFVINTAFFGWTIFWATPWTFLISLPPLVIITALIAGYGPARQAAHLSIAEGVKME